MHFQRKILLKPCGLSERQFLLVKIQYSLPTQANSLLLEFPDAVLLCKKTQSTLWGNFKGLMVIPGSCSDLFDNHLHCDGYEKNLR